MEREISAKDLKKILNQNKNAVLLDVRSKQEYSEGHLNGSISIPYYEIESKAKKIIPNRKDLIIVYCQHGTRSRDTVNKLNKLGYENVFNLKNGLDEF